MILLSACKSPENNESMITDKENISHPKVKATSPEMQEIAFALNLSKEIQLQVNRIELRYNSSKAKLVEDKMWSGPKNRQNRAKFSKGRMRALNRVLGKEKADLYNKMKKES